MIAGKLGAGMTTYTSCKTCTSRRDCWIWSTVIELRPFRLGLSDLCELALKASRGECPLYTEEADLDG